MYTVSTSWFNICLNITFKDGFHLHLNEPRSSLLIVSENIIKGKPSILVHILVTRQTSLNGIVGVPLFGSSQCCAQSSASFYAPGLSSFRKGQCLTI